MKVLISVIVILGVAYYIRSTFQNVINTVTAPPPTCLELVGNTTAEEEGVTHIIGSIKNNCDRGYSMVTISFKLDAQAGSDFPAGSAVAYVRNLHAGDTMEFKTVVPISKTTTYRFDEITAY